MRLRLLLLRYLALPLRLLLLLRLRRLPLPRPPEAMRRRHSRAKWEPKSLEKSNITDSFSLMDSLEEENKVPVDESQLDKDATFDNGSPLNTNIVVQEDYICTDADLALIDWIKEIPCEPRVEVVLIDDACVERKWIECLFQPGAYLGDEVIDCYINLIKTTQQLKCRSGGRVHIENAFQFNFLKRDGDVKTKTDELYPITDMAQICSAERRVLLYLDHDMVFIPINIRGTHCSSCGLFLLNYIEYWTGDELSDSFTQDDMSHFRKKLAAILLSSYMNKRRGYPIYKYDKEVHTGSPSDVEILDSPTNHKKRKLLHVLDNSEVLMEDEDGPITQADLQRWFVDEWDKRTPTKVSADGCTDDFLMSGLSTKDMSVTKADLIDVLCDYIMAIQDDRTLEMIWVRSFNPFKIEISVKDLQNILSINLDTTLKCFDMAVRLLANKESRRPKGEIIKNRKHYMDMRFWRMTGFGKLPKYHQDPTAEELTKTLDCWPSMNYYITACKYVLMPWKFNGCYALFVIDHGKNTSLLLTLHLFKIGVSICHARGSQKRLSSLQRNIRLPIARNVLDGQRIFLSGNIQFNLVFQLT
ncbi:hypothetical protein ZEAMMB73_Zm00001d018576 [Zea mays]|uniref:Ubiquitin-like protease family profile domain-containing protein n=2 Tax=Zea mays TaxID=4577 RepID=A0A1D6HQF8_MAIZE|nr:hypothetical protein ZEAMMB73_Zm00001d018576 [Zea mays]